MNKDNLLRMADHIETIPQKDFDMELYRKGTPIYPTTECNIECDTVGCAVGHCTILDSDNVKKNFINSHGNINFPEWSREFTDIYDEDQWDYLFSGKWVNIDNSPKGTTKRIRYVVEHGFPQDMYEEIRGNKKLSYE